MEAGKLEKAEPQILSKAALSYKVENRAFIVETDVTGGDVGRN